MDTLVSFQLRLHGANQRTRTDSFKARLHQGEYCKSNAHYRNTK